MASKRTMLSLGWVATASLLLGAASDGPAPTTTTTFTIGGEAAQEFSPGVTVSLDLEITNPYERPLAVRDLRVWVMGLQAPNADTVYPCSDRDYALVQAPATPALTVPANSTLPLSRLGLEPASWPQVTMVNLPVNQDGCQGAIVDLRYTASGALEA